MMEEKVRSFFEVKAGEVTPAFDLDYSQLEIAQTQKLREEDANNINRVTFRDLVAEHPFFAAFFHWLRYDTPYVLVANEQKDDSGKKIRKEKRGNAIPVELLSFFKLYMLEVMSKKAFSTDVRKGKVPEAMQESLNKRLLEYANKEEHSVNPDNSELYWTRTLFDDSSIRKTAARDLWETEYELRARGLYEQVKKLTPEQQLAMFQNVVSFLNNQIALASRWDTYNSSAERVSKTDLKQFLTEFPKKVISKCRDRIVQSGSKALVAYRVENMPLHIEGNDADGDDTAEEYRSISSLKDAGVRLRGNIRGSLKLKKAARAVYLRGLIKKAEKSEFQKDYEKTLAYINACTVEISQGWELLGGDASKRY